MCVCVFNVQVLKMLTLDVVILSQKNLLQTDNKIEKMEKCVQAMLCESNAKGNRKRKR